MALHHLGVLLRLLPLLLGLLPLLLGGLLRTSLAAVTETHGLLLGHAIDEDVAQGEDEGPEVIGPALLLVKLEPGKETIKLRKEIREYKRQTTYPAVRSGFSPGGRPARVVGRGE